MARTKAAKTRRDADPWRAKVVAHVTACPGVTVGDVSRHFPKMPRAQVWALLSSACSRRELDCKPDQHVFRFYPKEDRPVGCSACLGSGMVCEDHPEHPAFTDVPGHAEHAPGMPCPACSLRAGADRIASLAPGWASRMRQEANQVEAGQ